MLSESLTASVGAGVAKVLVVALDLGGGGAERVIVTLLSKFEKDFPHIAFELLLLKERPDAFAVGTLHLPITRLKKARLRAAILPLARHIRRSNPDLIFSHLTSANIAVRLAALLSGRRVKTVAVAHGLYGPEVFAAFGRFRGGAVKKLARWAYQSSSRVVAVSQGVAATIQQILGVNGKNIRTIYNPIYGEYLEQLSAEEPPEPWLREKSAPVLMAAGRLSPEKDFSTLLRALALVRIKTPARLLILGEGPLRRELETLTTELGLREVVRFVGFVANPFAYFRRADLFVLSSIREGFANVLVEAMACGCTVVATDCGGGPSEILAHGQYGQLAPCANPEALAAAILAGLRDPAAKERLIARAKQFSITASAQAYADLFMELLQPKSSA